MTKVVRMGRVVCGITISADGYTAGPNQTEERPFGDDGGDGWGDQLHAWFADTPDENRAEVDEMIAGLFRKHFGEASAEGMAEDYLEEMLACARDTLPPATERDGKIEDLRESEHRLRQIVESIQEVVWLTDPEKTRMLYINPAFERIWGQPRESVYESPRSFLDAIVPEDRERIVRSLPKQVLGLCNSFVIHKMKDPQVVTLLKRMVGDVDEGLWDRLPNLAAGQAIVSFPHFSRPLMVSIDPETLEVSASDLAVARDWRDTENRVCGYFASRGQDAG